MPLPYALPVGRLSLWILRMHHAIASGTPRNRARVPLSRALNRRRIHDNGSSDMQYWRTVSKSKMWGGSEAICDILEEVLLRACRDADVDIIETPLHSEHPSRLFPKFVSFITLITRWSCLTCHLLQSTRDSIHLKYKGKKRNSNVLEGSCRVWNADGSSSLSVSLSWVKQCLVC